MERLRRAALGWATLYPALHLVLWLCLVLFVIGTAASGGVSGGEIVANAPLILGYGALGAVAVAVPLRARRATRGRGVACLGLAGGIAGGFALGLLLLIVGMGSDGGWFPQGVVWLVVPVGTVAVMLGLPPWMGGVVAGSYAVALGLGGWLTLRRAG